MSQTPNETNTGAVAEAPRAPAPAAGAVPEPAAPHVSARAMRTMAIARWCLLLVAAGAALWAWTRAAPDAAGVRGPDRFACPMHPQVRSPEPGICPICSMTLEPIPDHAAAGHAGAAGAEPAELPPEARAPIMLTFERRTLAGIALAPVVADDLAEEVVWPARLDVPESALAEVRARTEGFVERVAPYESGQRVAVGETLAWLYAPEVAKARAELEAVRRFDPPDAAAVAAAQLRLKRLGDRGASGWLEVKAPIAGTILSREVALGGFVEPASVLFKLADLGTLRVVASAPADVAAFASGADAFWRAADGAELPLRFDRVAPVRDPATRTAEVRFLVANAEGALAPGALGAVVVRHAAERRLLVPRDAVVATAAGPLVFVETEPGVLTPTPVTLGPRFGERRAIVAGVVLGARVVARGAFLVDAESRLQATFAPAAPATPASPASPGAMPMGKEHSP